MGIIDAIGDWIHDMVDGPGSKPTLAELGADPDQVPKGGAAGAPGGGAGGGDMFPNASGSSVMDQVNKSMDIANENYREGMEIAKDAPKMPSAGEQAQGIIDGVRNASPEQLERMARDGEGMAIAEDIRGDVDKSHHDLLDRKTEHEVKIGEDRALIDAERVEKDAQAAIDRAKDVS
jgi:hypothetical protein